MTTKLQDIFDTANPKSFRTVTDEHREKVRKTGQANRGRKHTAETRARVSAASKQRQHSEETRKKMSAWQKGKTVSETTRQRISEANTGKPSWKQLGKKSPAFKRLMTPWGEFESVKAFLAWCPTVGLVNARNNLKRGMQQLPDQFYFVKDPA
jgi:hypothetical protein